MLGPRDRITTNGGLDLYLIPDQGTVQTIPTAGVDYAHELQFSSLTAGVGLRGFFDRLALTYSPQFFTSASASMRWSPDFESRASLFFSTILQDSSSDNGQLGTNVGFDLPSAYALSRTLSLRFGARASLSAPPLWESNRSGSQAQAIAYLGLDFIDGTGPGRGSFMR